MSYVIALPQTLPAVFGIGFRLLVTATGALPYNVDGIAAVGIEGEGAKQLPSLVDLDRTRRSTPSVPYRGSAALSEMLDSSPRALQIAAFPLADGMGESADFFASAANDDISVRNIIAEHSGTRHIARLAFKYSKAVLVLDRLEADRADASPAINDVRDFLGSISPMALEAADRGALVMGDISAPPYISYAKHCLLFLAGALSAAFRHPECSKYAIKALGRMGDFFKMHDAAFKRGEGLAIKASGLEIVAEMLRVNRLPGEDVGFIYPQQIFPEIASTWIGQMEHNPSGPDREGIYMRALNAAQWQPDYESLESVFLMANSMQKDDLGSTQFLIRAAWAALMEEGGDRPEAEKWELVGEYLKGAETHLNSGKVTGGGQLADLASKVRARTEGYAEKLTAQN